MIIGIDGNEANQSKRVGVGEYGYQVLTHLKYQISNIKYQNYNLKFKIYLKEKPLPDLPKETSWWQYKVVGPKFLWTQIGLPIALFRDRPYPSVFFTPTHYSPRFCPCPRVISIMDLSFIYFPEMFKKEDLFKLKSWTAYSIKKAKKILAISKSTRDDIIKYYQVEPEKAVVTYPGMNKKLATQTMPAGRQETRKDMEDTEKLKKKYKIDGDYILYVGTLQPRKNLVRLIEAFAKTKNRFPNEVRKLAMSVASKPKSLLRKAPSERKNTKFRKSEIPFGKKKLNIDELKLVIAGKKGWMYEEIFEKVKELSLEKEIVFTGYVPEKDLSALYKGAKCFVLVSLYEGFGLPALEALSFGVPVVVSNTSSLPEVVGDAGVLVDPYDVKDIARGIIKVLQVSPKERQSMSEKGKAWAKKFSWEKCAKETLKVLMEAAKKKHD